MGADFVRDSNGQDITPISDDNSIRASFFYPDRTPPVLEGFSLDLNSAVLTLSLLRDGTRTVPLDIIYNSTLL